VMNTCFRITWLTLFAVLFFVNPGLLSVHPDGCSHASEIPPPLEIRVVSNSSNKAVPVYAVQVSACREEKNARDTVERLRGRGYRPKIHLWKDSSGSLWHSVFLGVYEDAAEAGQVALGYREAEGKPVFVKTLDRRIPEEASFDESSALRQAETAAPDREEAAPEETQAVRDEEPEIAEEEGIGPEFTCSGFIEFESFVNTGTGRSFKDSNEKNEIRNRLQLRYGTESFYLFSVSNIYLFQTYLNKSADDHYRYTSNQQVSRNMRLSSREAELSFDELYLNYGGENFRLRAGNQIYGWGTADAFNPTSYFNPSDMREILFRDDDENKAGVPSLSGMFFLGDYTLEAVFVPVHIPTIMAPEENFWALSINSFLLPIVFEEPEKLGADIDNVGYGARLSTSMGRVDMSVSGYHGPDKDPTSLPYRVIFQGITPVAVQLRPQTSIVTMFGFDLSAALGDFVVQIEAAYSPDKTGIVEQRVASLPGMTLPFETEKVRYVSYAAGFNYFIPLSRLIEGHTGDTVFTFEWFQSRYLESGVYSPSITDIVSCKLEDSYFDGRVKMTVKGIFDTQHGGKVFWPEIGYDFQNGLFIEVGYAAIWGDRGSSWESDSIFYYFRDNDLLMAKVRYEY